MLHFESGVGLIKLSTLLLSGLVHWYLNFMFDFGDTLESESIPRMCKKEILSYACYFPFNDKVSRGLVVNRYAIDYLWNVVGKNNL